MAATRILFLGKMMRVSEFFQAVNMIINYKSFFFTGSKFQCIMINAHDGCVTVYIPLILWAMISRRVIAAITYS